MLKKIGAKVMVRTACTFFGGLLKKWLGPLGIALSMIFDYAANSLCELINEKFFKPKDFYPTCL